MPVVHVQPGYSLIKGIVLVTGQQGRREQLFTIICYLQCKLRLCHCFLWSQWLARTILLANTLQYSCRMFSQMSIITPDFGRTTRRVSQWRSNSVDFPWWSGRHQDTTDTHHWRESGKTGQVVLTVGTPHAHHLTLLHLTLTPYASYLTPYTSPDARTFLRFPSCRVDGCPIHWPSGLQRHFCPRSWCQVTHRGQYHFVMLCKLALLQHFYPDLYYACFCSANYYFPRFVIALDRTEFMFNFP